MNNLDNLNTITGEDLRDINGGYKIYSCPWNDFRSTNFWSVYGHAIACAYKSGIFDLPIWMIKVGLGGLF